MLQPRTPTARFAAWRHRAAPAAGCAALLWLALCAPAAAADAACAATPHCKDLGAFTATVVKVNVTRQDAVTAYQGVRTTVRFSNTGAQPLILGYRDGSSTVSDDKGLVYRWSAKAYGIGVVSRNAADPQFQLAPGESREASFDGVVQYSMRQQVAGSVFSHDIGIVQLVLLDGQRVREKGEYALGFSDLRATAGFGAGAAAAGAAPVLPAAVAQPAAPPAATAGVAAASAGCDGAERGSCQAAGPLVARVLRVNVTRSGSVTAYQGVRTTLRIQNVGTEPLILGYRKGSAELSDNTGQAYRWSSKAEGIGSVDANSADAQFSLAPGQSRDAVFESTLQYNVRHSQPGNVFSHDLILVELAIVGPGQVRSLRDHALSFSNLRASSGFGGAAAAGDSAGTAASVDDAAQAIGKMVDLFKSMKK